MRCKRLLILLFLAESFSQFPYQQYGRRGRVPVAFVQTNVWAPEIRPGTSGIECYTPYSLCHRVEWVSSPLVDSRHVRTRSLGKFARMIKTLTGRGPLDYNLYGNYCGFGGTGQPVDDIDRCCLAHDDCYTSVQQRGCIPYFSPYDVNITGLVIKCVTTGQFCLDEACRCDETAARCFALFEYNPINKRRFRLLTDGSTKR